MNIFKRIVGFVVSEIGGMLGRRLYLGNWDSECFSKLHSFARHVNCTMTTIKKVKAMFVILKESSCRMWDIRKRQYAGRLRLWHCVVDPMDLSVAEEKERERKRARNTCRVGVGRVKRARDVVSHEVH